MGSLYSRARRRLVQGIGVNDANYAVHSTIDGKRSVCPFYICWGSMLNRCSEACKSRNPTYTGCDVCADWRSFMAFREWMQAQAWEGKELDKDLIGDGKLYSPENCVFVPARVNTLFIDSSAIRGKYPVGVSLDKKSAKFRANINLNSKWTHLGLFTSAEDAHAVWLNAKISIANSYLESEADPRVRYAIQCGIDKLKAKHEVSALT